MYTTLYATAFAVELIRRKRSEFKTLTPSEITPASGGWNRREIARGSTTSLGVEDVAHALRSAVLEYVGFIGPAL